MATISSAAPTSDLRYPVGKFTAPENITPEHLDNWICEIEHLPARLREAIAGLSEEQLDTPYRPDGWTVRQLVHHLADSHINAYTRFRFALTESNPLIKPYDEAVWAELPDAKSAPVDSSLSLLTGLHKRWTMLLHSLDKSDWKKTYQHPEYTEGKAPLDHIAGLYAWHSRHHVAHIRALRACQGW